MAVFECAPEASWEIDDRDIEAKASSRSQHQNRKAAQAILEARVRALMDARATSGLAQSRRLQVGSGMRGDKIRTYREQDDLATDHRSGRKARLHRVRQGNLELLG